MEVDGRDEVLLVAKATSGVLHPLDLGVQRLAGGVCHSVPDVGDDILEASLEHAGHLDHRFQATPHRPVVPPTKVLPCRPLVSIHEERHS